MKVICIDDSPGTFVNPSGFLLECGAVYNVIEIFLGELTKKICYRLREDRWQGGYKAERFMPLSSIDEKEFERNYIHNPINQ